MCGIAGIAADRADATAIAAAMIAPLIHRGPDGSGVATLADGRVALGHRRLAIVDLSPHGAQPMDSADGRWCLSYNGEIYNAPELRLAAPDHKWRGHSDTEALVEAIARKGVRGALERSVGMFAFAAFDRETRHLTLARDRFGEKPLYYGWVGKDFLFASELKAFRVHPDYATEIEPRALHAFFASTVVPAPWSIQRRVFKLEPGHILTVDLSGTIPSARNDPPAMGQDGGLTLERFWDYRAVVQQGLDCPIADPREAEDALEQALTTAIAAQLVADVPVGAFLSGGIDSSTVVALAQARVSQAVKTYSIGFEDPAFDESGHARRIAEVLGTDHHEQIVSVAEARSVIPELPAIYDEPFADSSQIPTVLVSRFARSDVTVALSGDGGDELFAGYNRHSLAPAAWARAKRLPGPLRSAAGRLGAMMPEAAFRLAGKALGGHPDLPAKMRKASRILADARHFDDVYGSFFDEWQGRGPVEAPGAAKPFEGQDAMPEIERMLVRDATEYLPDDILTKVDRAAMSCSLETRIPFLDHRVAELAARIPSTMKLGGGKGKLILRRLLARHVDPALFERPKAGFGIPVGDWVRGPLRDWAETLVHSPKLAATGLIDPAIVERRWQDHLRGGSATTPGLWAALMFSAWLETQ